MTQGDKEKEATFRATAEASVLKVKAKAENKTAIHKGKAEEEKEAAFLKAKAEAAIIEAKAETEKEEGIIEAYYAPEEDDAPYEKLCNGYNSDEDPEVFMARMLARWNAFIKDEEARFPGLGYREYSVGEYSVDDSPDSDDEQEYYLRKLEGPHGVEGCEVAALVI